MKAIPMLFNAEMVRALAAGRKTVTRRPWKQQPTLEPHTNPSYWQDRNIDSCPIVSVGDLIWVRETFQPYVKESACYLTADFKTGENVKVAYPATDDLVLIADPDGVEDPQYKLTPSIHMPKWASRLTLRVTAIRAERIQSISKEQARAEGVSSVLCEKDWWDIAYKNTWNSIYNNWSENPFVWVIEFEVINQNINKVIEKQGEAA